MKRLGPDEVVGDRTVGACGDCVARRIGVCSAMQARPGIEALEGARFPMRTLRPRESLLRQGDLTDTVYTLTSGWAALHHDLPDGRGGITAFAVPGDVLGLAPAEAPFPATVSAITRATVCGIPTSRHARLRQDFEALNERFIWQMERESALMFETLAHIAGAPAATRLGHLLHTLAVRSLAPRALVEAEPIWLPLTQQHLAQATGLTPVHVSRTLQRLRDRELVDFQKQRLIILDLAGLEEIAGSSRALLGLWGGGAGPLLPPRPGADDVGRNRKAILRNAVMRTDRSTLACDGN